MRARESAPSPAALPPRLSLSLSLSVAPSIHAALVVSIVCGPWKSSLATSSTLWPTIRRTSRADGPHWRAPARVCGCSPAGSASDLSGAEGSGPGRRPGAEQIVAGEFASARQLVAEGRLAQKMVPGHKCQCTGAHLRHLRQHRSDSPFVCIHCTSSRFAGAAIRAPPGSHPSPGFSPKSFFCFAFLLSQSCLASDTSMQLNLLRHKK